VRDQVASSVCHVCAWVCINQVSVILVRACVCVDIYNHVYIICVVGMYTSLLMFVRARERRLRIPFLRMYIYI